MNHRLQELMLEAGYAAPELAGRANKLAELIVRECAKQAYREELTVEEGMMRYRCILEHFGVEE